MCAKIFVFYLPRFHSPYCGVPFCWSVSTGFSLEGRRSRLFRVLSAMAPRPSMLRFSIWLRLRSTIASARSDHAFPCPPSHPLRDHHDCIRSPTQRRDPVPHPKDLLASPASSRRLYGPLHVHRVQLDSLSRISIRLQLFLGWLS